MRTSYVNGPFPVGPLHVTPEALLAFVGLAAMLALEHFVGSEVVDAGDVLPVALRVPERHRAELAGDRAGSVVLVPQLVRPQGVPGGECLAADVTYASLQGMINISFPLTIV